MSQTYAIPPMPGGQAMPSGQAVTAYQPKAVAESPLFRPEVVEANRNQWLGTVLLVPRIHTTFLTLVAMAMAAAVIAFLLFGSYTRKERIQGWLVPEQGLSQIYVPQTGVVTKLHVSEGMTVTKGMALADISGEIQSQSVGATIEEVLQKLKERRETARASHNSQNALYDQKEADLKRQIDTLEFQRTHIQNQIDLQDERLKVSADTLRRERQMLRENIIALSRVQRTEQDHLDQLGRQQSLEREMSQLQSQIEQVRANLNEVPMLRQTALADIDRNISSIEQEIAESEARRETVLVAPHDGVVTAIMIEEGGRAFPNTPVLSIVPAGSKLQAHLFSPSRAIGFLKQGQRVSLRYQPFPYQKFGLYGGSVSSISKSSVSPADLPRQFAKANATDPVYRVTVTLDQQDVKAYGNAVALQPGMELEADVQMDRRSLIEWVLDPLYTITGKVGSGA